MNVCCKDMYVKLYFRTLLYGLVDWQDCRFLGFFGLNVFQPLGTAEQVAIQR